MELFKLTLPTNSETVPLYLNGAGSFIVERNRVRVGLDCTLGLDTFFNLFSHTKYVKYTRVGEVSLQLNLKGAFSVRLMCALQDGERLLCEAEHSGEGVCSLPFRVDDPALCEGFVYATLTAREVDCFFLGGSYVADVAPETVKVGLVICTFKRESFVKNTVANVENYLVANPEMRDNVGVFVVDNGKTLAELDFPDDTLLFPNKNLGGAGGFTRGIIEVHARQSEGFTHFLLMDDDIEFNPEILNKTINILRTLKPEFSNACIGGAMLPLDEPCLQFEMGAFWKERYVEANLRGLMLTKRATLLANELEYDVDYSAWWYFCMPVGVVDRVGLPLPLFIKADDVEYSLRGAEHFILMNGIAVWHESFDRKPVDWLEYYIKRNELIVCALHSNGKTMFKNYVKALKGIAKAIVKQKYYKADLIFKAYSDFLKGPSWLGALDDEQYHKSILAGSPKMLTPQEVQDITGVSLSPVALNQEFRQQQTEPNRTLRRFFTLNGYLIPRCFYGKYKKDYKVIHMTQDRVVNYYKASHIISYHPELNLATITHLNKTEMLKTSLKLLGLLFKLTFKYRKSVKLFRSHLSTLTTP